jgi:ectoine hydroxylase-related dioxygenase (phytanoyl-CoA dioxygenase family)
MINKIEECVAKIQSDGYVVLKNAIDSKSIKEMLSFIKSYEYTSSEKEKIALSKMRLNEYAENLFNVALKKPEYLKYFIRGLQGEIAKRLLNDEYYKSIPAELPNYILRSMLARSSTGAMPYHIDSFIPYMGNTSSVIQMVIFLEKSDEQRGCTKIVSGSHLSGIYAPQNNVDELYVKCDPGDIVIWDSRLWHATTENKSEHTRWALICTFCRWYIKQGFDYPRALSLDTYEALDIDERIVFGYASRVPLDELERTEVKGSLELVKN